MNESRPFGVMLIALYFLLEAMALICASLIGYAHPTFRVGANEFISHFAVFLQQLKLASYGIELAPMLAIVALVQGLGIWFLKDWARSLVYVLIVCWFCEAAAAVTILWAIDQDFLLSCIKTPYFGAGFLTRVIMFYYLRDPDTKRVFGVKDDDIL